jgi:hypothetical protein
MKTHIWNATKSFPDKVNFVDSKNVFLGYDLRNTCCEWAHWSISESPNNTNPIHKGSYDDGEKEIELDGYCFDPNFFEKHEDESVGLYTDTATFKLEHHPKWGTPKQPDLFLRLTNVSNGYYGHGFTFHGATTIKGML